MPKLSESNMNIVFYDGQCGLCDHTVQFLLHADKKKLFHFAPLQGRTAQRVLKELSPDQQKEDSLVLVENYGSSTEKFYLLGKASLRILWLLDGPWLLLGWLSFLPSFLYDWIYRLIARHRHRFFGTTCSLPNPAFRGRFLD